MKIALDTNRYVDFRRGVPDVVETLEKAEAVVLPFVTLAELRFGFLRGNRHQENEEALAKFRQRPGVSVMFADESTTAIFAELMLQLRKQGTPIPTNDVWIAALALQDGLVLYARDRHFEHLPQVIRL